MSRDELGTQADEFADRLNDLLRRTARTDAGVTVRIDRDGRALVGFGTKLRAETIPVPISGGGGDAHLLVWFDLTLDPSNTWLMVRKSTFGLYMLTGTREPVFRYEFVRDDRYIPAHLHVHGQSSALGRLYALAGKDVSADLSRLHLPVGGKRFRPSLEDVLESLFQEQLLQPLDGWRDAVEQHRNDFHERQLRAAIRAQPEIAASKLEDMGYTVTPPADPPAR